MKFTSLRLSDPILRALAEEGYETPTPIQAQSIPPLLDGRDLLGCAQTGTGKTAAFALPILHRLSESPRRKGRPTPRALVLSPTRELATQIAESFATYGRHLRLSGTVIYGGVSQHRQVRDLQRGVDIVVATPGRLIDLMDQGHVDFSAIEALVLDEADRMLDMGFIHPIRRIVAAIPNPRQTMLFSATMPKEIVKLADSLLSDPVRIAVTPIASAAPMIDQSVYMIPRQSKQALLEHLLRQDSVSRAVVFTRTKHGADKVCKKLVQSGVTAAAIHGNKAQNQRQRTLDSFRRGRSRVLVATDVAARGLDVDGITHVFNFDLPNEPDAYVHRIGRTGRAGATGIAISFCDGEERAFLKAIEKRTGERIPVIADLPDLARREPSEDGPVEHPSRTPRHTHAHGAPRRSGPIAESAASPHPKKNASPRKKRASRPGKNARRAARG